MLGVQLLSNKIKWGALWWPRASQYGSKWRSKIFAWYFVAFDVPLRMKLWWRFDTLHFDTWKWATVSLTGFEEWNQLIKCKLDWLDIFWCSETTSLSISIIKNLYLKSKFHITKENYDFNSKRESALFGIQPSVMLMAITFKVFDKSVWYLVWISKMIFPISSINKIVNDENIGVKINTWIWVSILFVNAVVLIKSRKPRKD